MTTVTGFTAARMLDIENNSIISGTIVGDNLILTRQGGGTVNAGNVRGATGDPGVSLADFNAHLPIGVVLDYMETVAPNSKWLTMVGQTVTNAQTLYPDWWAKLPASMKSGANAIMPDTRGKVSVGYSSIDTDFDAIGETGGAKTHTLTKAQLPADTITIDPPLTSVTHHDAGQMITYTGTGVVGLPGSGSISVQANSGLNAFDTWDVDIAPFQSGNLGSGQAHNNVQPYVTFLKIVKVL